MANCFTNKFILRPASFGEGLIGRRCCLIHSLNGLICYLAFPFATLIMYHPLSHHKLISFVLVTTLFFPLSASVVQHVSNVEVSHVLARCPECTEVCVTFGSECSCPSLGTPAATSCLDCIKRYEEWSSIVDSMNNLVDRCWTINRVEFGRRHRNVSSTSTSVSSSNITTQSTTRTTSSAPSSASSSAPSSAPSSSSLPSASHTTPSSVPTQHSANSGRRRRQLIIEACLGAAGGALLLLLVAFFVIKKASAKRKVTASGNALPPTADTKGLYVTARIDPTEPFVTPVDIANHHPASSTWALPEAEIDHKRPWNSRGVASRALHPESMGGSMLSTSAGTVSLARPVSTGSSVNSQQDARSPPNLDRPPVSRPKTRTRPGLPSYGLAASSPASAYAGRPPDRAPSSQIAYGEDASSSSRTIRPSRRNLGWRQMDDAVSTSSFGESLHSPRLALLFSHPPTSLPLRRSLEQLLD